MCRGEQGGTAHLSAKKAMYDSLRSLRCVSNSAVAL